MFLSKKYVLITILLFLVGLNIYAQELPIKAGKIVELCYQFKFKTADSIMAVYFSEMKQGEDAVRRMAEMDQSRGLQTPSDVARRMRESKTRDAKTTPPIMSSSSDVLGDQALATNFRQQAAKMDAEARGLLAESARLLKEAAAMDPVQAVPETPKKRAYTKKAVVEAVAEPVAKVRKTKAKVSV
jgi:hypothetical protein